VTRLDVGHNIAANWTFYSRDFSLTRFERRGHLNPFLRKIPSFSIIKMDNIELSRLEIQLQTLSMLSMTLAANSCVFALPPRSAVSLERSASCRTCIVADSVTDAVSLIDSTECFE
jgi:hypothetical protein